MHDISSRPARYTLAILGLLASVVLLACSMLMNFKSGYALGRTSWDGYIYGVAAACADILLAGSPFFFFAALRKRAAVQAISAIVVWCITLAFAAQSAIGHVALNRLDVTSARQMASDNYGDVRESLKAARTELGFVPKHRGTEAVRAEIAKHKVSPIWSQSNECTELNKWSRPYCAQYEGLKAELGDALAADKLNARIQLLEGKSERAAPNAASVDDPQARTLSTLSGLDVRTTQGLLMLATVLMILSCAGLGPYVSTSVLGGNGSDGRGQLVTVDAAVIERIEDEEAAPLPAPDRMLALSAPREKRASPSHAGASLLRAIGMPTERAKGDKRPKDMREVVAWRFLAWLTAHNLSGDYTVDRLDELYLEFAACDHREETSPRFVRQELGELRRYASTSVPRGSDGRRTTMWSIKCPSIPRLIEQLEKRNVIASTSESGQKEEASGGARVIPFLDAGVARSKSQAELSAYAYAIKLANLPLGADWEDHHLTDLARQQKAAWQARAGTRSCDRKQRNRLARARAAA